MIRAWTSDDVLKLARLVAENRALLMTTGPKPAPLATDDDPQALVNDLLALALTATLVREFPGRRVMAEPSLDAALRYADQAVQRTELR